MQFWKRSIQRQLILSMGAALLASTFIVIAMYSSVVNHMVDRYLIGEALHSKVTAVRSELDRALTVPVTATASIAGNSLIQDWLGYGENPQRMMAFVRYLATVKTQQNALTTSIAVLESGNYYSEDGLTRTLDRANEGDAWFYSLVDGSADRSADIDIDEATKQPTLFINQRIVLEGKTLGVAGLGYSLQSMSELIGDFRFGEHGMVYLVGEDGQIKVHPDGALNNSQPLRDLIGPGAADALNAAGTDVVRFERNGETILALAQRLDSLGLTLVSEVPENEIYAEAHQLLWKTSLVGLGIALAFLVLIVLLARGMVRPIREVTSALVEIGGGAGDLSRRLDDRRADELGDLARGFNGFTATLRTLIADVKATSLRLGTAVGQVSSVVEDTAKRADKQHEMTDMVATSVHEMGLTVQDIALNASNAAQSSQTARNQAIEAKAVVGRSVSQIETMSADIGEAANTVTRLAAQVASIDKVLSVIRGVSEQTNLLALNAAIEAARAGEMGRGFAVVADEVRTLASRTQASTEEIHLIIRELQDGAVEAVRSMHAVQEATVRGVAASQQTGESLSLIADGIDSISDMNVQVATATEEQSAVTDDVTKHIQGIADLARATLTEVQACRDDCQTLGKLAQDLGDQMGRFKL